MACHCCRSCFYPPRVHAISLSEFRSNALLCTLHFPWYWLRKSSCIDQPTCLKLRRYICCFCKSSTWPNHYWSSSTTDPQEICRYLIWGRSLCKFKKSLCLCSTRNQKLNEGWTKAMPLTASVTKHLSECRSSDFLTSMWNSSIRRYSKLNTNI